jgi:transcriptional regulator with XRE-family HTH domain
MALSSVVALPRREQDGARRLVAEHLGRRVRRRRRVMGLTQNELARALDLPFEDIQKFETASIGLSEAELQRLASVLMAPVSYFYAGLDEDPDALAT